MAIAHSLLTAHTAQKNQNGRSHSSSQNIDFGHLNRMEQFSIHAGPRWVAAGIGKASGRWAGV